VFRVYARGTGTAMEAATFSRMAVMRKRSIVAPVLLAIVLAGVLIPVTASAQSPRDTTQRAAPGTQVSQPPVRLWSVSIAAGSAGGRSTHDLEAAMRAGGFDDRTPDFIFTGRDHPYSEGAGGGATLTICRRFGKMAHVRAVVGRSSLGETHGFTLDGSWGWIDLKQSVSTYAIMAGINEADGGFWVAGGPGLYRVTLADDLSGRPDITADRLGAVVGLGFLLPVRKRFLVELQSQYRLVGSAVVGPIDVGFVGHPPAGTLPRTRVNFDHGVLLLGLGVRL
jgi:hypothetical protein